MRWALPCPHLPKMKYLNIMAAHGIYTKKWKYFTWVKMCVSSILFLQKCVELLSCAISSVGGRLYLKTAKIDSKGGVCIVQGIICIFRGRVCTAWLLSTWGIMCGGQTVESWMNALNIGMFPDGLMVQIRSYTNTEFALKKSPWYKTCLSNSFYPNGMQCFALNCKKE